jgi:hypothetical protein
MYDFYGPNIESYPGKGNVHTQNVFVKKINYALSFAEVLICLYINYINTFTIHFVRMYLLIHAISNFIPISIKELRTQ